MTKAARLVEEFYNGTAEKDWPCWGQEIVSEVESRRAACSSLPDGPVAWLCEFMREDDTVDRQVVLEDPEGTRWADMPDGDGVSPFTVTPLFARPALAAPSAQPPVGIPAAEYLAKVKADPLRAAALERARERAGLPSAQPSGAPEVQAEFERGKRIGFIKGYRAACGNEPPRTAPTPSGAPADTHEAVAKVVSSGPHDFPLLQWLSADHSFRYPIGTLLYAEARAALAGAPAVQEGGARKFSLTQWQIVVRTLLDVEHSLVVASALCPEPSIEEFRPELAAITRALNVLGYRHGKDAIPMLDEIYVDKKD